MAGSGEELTYVARWRAPLPSCCSWHASRRHAGGPTITFFALKTVWRWTNSTKTATCTKENSGTGEHSKRGPVTRLCSHLDILSCSVDPKDSQSFTLFGRPVVQGYGAPVAQLSLAQSHTAVLLRRSSSVQPQLAAIRYLSRGDIINPRQAQVLLPQQVC